MSSFSLNENYAAPVVRCVSSHANHHSSIRCFFIPRLDFLAASIDHLFTLIVGIAPVLYTLNHPDPQLTSRWFCKLRGYLFQVCLMLSRWFVTFACIDRYILSSDRVSLRNFATKKNSYRTIASIIVVWTIICTHRLIFYETDGRLCGILSNIPAAMYHSIYVIIGGGVLPSVIMILSAALINRNLLRKERRRVQMSVRDRRRNSLDQQVYRLLYTQIIFYVCITAPPIVQFSLQCCFINICQSFRWLFSNPRISQLQCWIHAVSVSGDFLLSLYADIPNIPSRVVEIRPKNLSLSSSDQSRRSNCHFE